MSVVIDDHAQSSRYIRRLLVATFAISILCVPYFLALDKVRRIFGNVNVTIIIPFGLMWLLAVFIVARHAARSPAYSFVLRLAAAPLLCVVVMYVVAYGLTWIVGMAIYDMHQQNVRAR